MLSMKGMRFPKDIILVCIRWYAAYALSYHNLEEMMAERGVSVDHSTVNQWSIRFLPLLEKIFRQHKRPVGRSWRMDEIYIQVRGIVSPNPRFFCHTFARVVIGGRLRPRMPISCRFARCSFDFVIQAPRYTVINIGDGVERSILQISQDVAALVGYTGKIEIDSSKPDGVPRKMLDSSRLAKFGRQAPAPCEQGLRCAIEDLYTRYPVGAMVS